MNFASFLGLFVAHLLLGFSFAYVDGGEPKRGRVLIDDSHSQEWEQAVRIGDESFYGDFSTYSMDCAAEHLARHFAVDVHVGSTPLTAVLQDYDVLVLKTPIIDYTREETAGLLEFVRQGGGLLMIGDHTDLLGMNSRLNQIADPFGLRLAPDSVRDLWTKYFVTLDESVWPGDPAPGRGPPIRFMTGCSTQAHGEGRICMFASGALSEEADYLSGSNFATVSNDPLRSSGIVGVGAWAQAGNGKVMILGDCTPFSSFDYFKGSHDRILLASVAFLNRRSTWRTHLAPIAAACAACILLAMLIRLAFGGAKRAGLLSWIGVAAMGC